MNKQAFGKALKMQLEKGYDVVTISRWAFRVYLDNCQDIDLPTTDMLEYLFRMEDDPQFEFTGDELYLLAEKLIRGEEDPIQEIIKTKMEKSGQS